MALNHYEQALKGLSSEDTISSRIRERAERKEHGLFSILEKINAPQYAVTNAIYQAIVNEEQSAIDIAKNMWDGLTLKEKYTTGDILTQIIQPESKVGKIAIAVAGFGGDIILDPLTYIGTGLLKGGKLLKVGEELASATKAARMSGKYIDSAKVFTVGAFGKEVAIPGTQVIVDPISKLINKVTWAARENAGVVSNALNTLTKVSTHMRPKGVDPILWNDLMIAGDKAKNLNMYITGQNLKKLIHLKDTMVKEGIDPTKEAEILQKYIRGITDGSASLTEVKEFMQSSEKLLKNVDILKTKMIDESGYNYVPNIWENLSEISKAKLGVSRAKTFTTSNKAFKNRMYKSYKDGLLVGNTGHYFKDGTDMGRIKIKDIGAKTAKDYKQFIRKLPNASPGEANKALGFAAFSENLPKLLYIQGAKTAQVVSGDSFYKAIKGLGVGRREGLDKGFVQSGATELAGLYFHKDVAEYIGNTYTNLFAEESMKKLLKTFDGIQNQWKGFSTFWNVAFHTRNAISNVLLGMNVGVNNPEVYGRSMSLLMKKAIVKEDAKYMDMFLKEGISRTGQMTGDITKGIDDMLMGAMDDIKAGKIIGGINKIGGKVGEFVENIFKLGVFIDMIEKKGYTPFEAGRIVKKTFFDYNDLTSFERNVLKRALPFYTFSRKNIPFQLETLINHPARLSKVLKFKNNVEVLTGPDEDYDILPKWLQNSAPIFIGKRNGTLRYIKLEGFIPQLDLEKLSEPVEAMMTLLSPVLKTPIEQMFNRTFYFGQPITKQKGIQGWIGYGEKDYLWTRIPGRLEHLSSLFRPVHEIEKVFGNKYKDKSALAKALEASIGSKTYEMDEKVLLKTFDKLSTEEARNISSQISSIKRLIETSPSRKEELTKDIKMLVELRKRSLLKAKKSRQKIREDR